MLIRYFRFAAAVLLSGCLLMLTAHAHSASVMVMGDSLSAAYGLNNTDEGWVSLLADRLEQRDHDVINASISGETTRGGMNRLPDLLDRYRPDYVIIALGGNDGLQGLNIVDIRDRIDTMVDYVEQADATPILLGIRIPPNYGPRYTEPFFDLFGEVAEARSVNHFLPFMLENVATDPDLMQRDGIHPTAQAQAIILDNVWSVLPEELTQE